MALDRQSIEKADFPVGEHGYEPEAVHAHLAALATEVEDLQRTTAGRSASLASSASERVHAIIEAAEHSAAEIHRSAEDEARGIRDQANHDAYTTREQAAEQAREYLGRVSEATGAMMQRLDSMEQELGALAESLRTGSGRLRSDVQQLESDLAQAAKTIVSPPGAEAPAARAEGAAGGEPTTSEVPVPEAAEFAEVVGGGESAGAGAGAASGGSDDAEGARLIALNMALNGTPRDETARYLSENFQLSDAGGLLDEVYASVEG